MSLRMKRFWSYLVALALSIAVFALIGQLSVWLLTWIYNDVSTINVVRNIGMTGVLAAIIMIANSLVKLIRTNPQPISIGATNIPNVFYDDEFLLTQNLADHELFEKNKDLEKKIAEQNELLKEMAGQLSDSSVEIDQIKYITDTFIRHHKNASRLVRSLTYLQEEGREDWFWEFCNCVLAECVTTLTKDRADKSSTLYFVEGNELEMFAYNRIEFSSTRERRFKKGEGFAGYIWETEQLAIEENVAESEHFQDQFAPKHSYGSILGCPIQIRDQVLGVLCIQSEKTSGFEQDDLIMTQFYADIAALAFYCHKNNDILKARKSEGGDSVDDQGTETISGS